MSGIERLNEANDWRQDMLCTRVENPDVFFPEGTDERGIALAKLICRSCPVIESCLADALVHEPGDGIVGGLTPGERGILRRKAA